MSPLPILPLLLLLGCQASGDSKDLGSGAGDLSAGQDLLHSHLALDLESLEGRATIQAQPNNADEEVRLDVSGLEVSAVSVNGHEVEVVIEEGRLIVPAPGSVLEVEVVVDYTFPERPPATFDGWISVYGVTFVWPYYCANLFPCDPSMMDGIAYSMEVTGYEEGLTAVYPEETWTDGPAYMAGLTVGDYAQLDLGETPSGTAIKAWYFDGPDGDGPALRGTAHLVDAFDYFERVYGPYAFGPEYGSVEVNWGDDSWGGMEHHPYSHIGTFDMNDEETHVHEAGHGWFGDGVRVACWEDFVLSEGTNSYITARALEQVGGPSQWAYYVDGFLTPACRGRDVNTVVLPSTCNEIDFVNDDLWSLVTYMKGACFYEDVADLIGADLLDEVIGDFYKAHVNEAMRMNDMLDAIRSATPAEDQEALETLIVEWLLTEECPEDYEARCKEHVPR